MSQTKHFLMLPIPNLLPRELMSETPPTVPVAPDSPYLAKPEDSYTKLAMKNMVRRGGTSLMHFALTTLGILGALVLLSVVFH